MFSTPSPRSISSMVWAGCNEVERLWLIGDPETVDPDDVPIQCHRGSTAHPAGDGGAGISYTCGEPASVVFLALIVPSFEAGVEVHVRDQVHGDRIADRDHLGAHPGVGGCRTRGQR